MGTRTIRYSAAAERFAIPELVDATLSHVECTERAGQGIFSKCALVSRSWSEIARRKRYTSLVYPINYPERDDYPDVNIGLKAQGRPQYRSLKMLLAGFDKYPFVCTYIRHFELTAHEFPVPGGQADDFYDDWVLSHDRQVPFLGGQKAGISSVTFVQVLCRLTSLRSLIVPDILADWWSLSALTTPVVPSLECLQIRQPALYEDISVARFGCFMRLFGTIRHLTLKGLWVHEIEDRRSPPSVDLPYLEVEELSLDDNWCRWSGALLQTISELPNHHMFTCLDLHWVPPNDIRALRNILNAVSANLRYLSLQLERDGPELYHDSEESLHYLQLDLTRCIRLRVLTFRMYYHFFDDHPSDATDSAASASVADFLTIFLDKRIPRSLPCLDLKISPSNNLDVQKVVFRYIEDLILRAMDDQGLRFVSLTPWWHGTFVTHWGTFSSFFPRIARKGALSYRNEFI